MPKSTEYWLERIWNSLGGAVGGASIDITDRAARILGVLSTGANIIGRVGIDQTTPGTTNKVTTDPITAMPTVYNVTLTNANTEYSQAMVANCRRFEFHARTDVVIRFAFVTGKVAAPAAPWMTLKSGVAYDSGMISQGAAPSTIYLASATAGTIVEIISWV